MLRSLGLSQQKGPHHGYPPRALRRPVLGAGAMSPRFAEAPLASLASPTLLLAAPTGAARPRERHDHGHDHRHDHSWALRAVTHEDGDVLEEYACSGCGELTFR